MTQFDQRSKEHALSWSSCPSKGQAVVEHRDVSSGGPELSSGEICSEQASVLSLTGTHLKASDTSFLESGLACWGI